MDPAAQLTKWTIRDSAELYNIDGWSAGYFSINAAGHLQATPRGNGAAIDMYELVRDLQKRGLDLPLLIRFPDILDQQVIRLNEAFLHAIEEYGYQGSYRGVFPIKVNQQRHVISEIASFGRRYKMGLEAGSKPELLIALTQLEPDDGLIICNGYKDRAFLETALLARRVGFSPIIVIERMAELSSVVEVARELGIEPVLGVRAKLSVRGRGKWSESAGERAKFGVRSANLVEVVQILREAGMLQCLKLLHFHLGSQVTAIRSITEALDEAGRLYVELYRAGAAMGYLDVGGGLAVDYDGSKSNFESSANYDVAEYARTIVDAMQTACQEAGVPEPSILSESGRALVAYSSVLVMEVLDTESVSCDPPPRVCGGEEEEPRVLTALYESLEELNAKSFQESFHDALYARDEALTLFNHGLLSLADRARVEQIFWCLCRRIRKIMDEQDYVPDELETLQRLLADTYYCNVSVFQSLPDAWAVKQIFPIVPLQQLLEKPQREAILADVTCDSDGRIDHFADLRDVRRVLPVHPVGAASYYLGVFLVGAYQEILGDLHNLFGDTHCAHVYLTESGYRIGNVVEGDSMAEVLSYLEYNRAEMVEALRRTAERALEAGMVTSEQTKRLMQNYRANLDGYTYLVTDDGE